MNSKTQFPRLSHSRGPRYKLCSVLEGAHSHPGSGSESWLKGHFPLRVSQIPSCCYVGGTPSRDSGRGDFEPGWKNWGPVYPLAPGGPEAAAIAAGPPDSDCCFQRLPQGNSCLVGSSILFWKSFQADPYSNCFFSPSNICVNSYNEFCFLNIYLLNCQQVWGRGGAAQWCLVPMAHSSPRAQTAMHLAPSDAHHNGLLATTLKQTEPLELFPLDPIPAYGGNFHSRAAARSDTGISLSCFLFSFSYLSHSFPSFSWDYHPNDSFSHTPMFQSLLGRNIFQMFRDPKNLLLIA